MEKQYNIKYLPTKANLAFAKELVKRYEKLTVDDLNVGYKNPISLFLLIKSIKNDDTCGLCSTVVNLTMCTGCIYDSIGLHCSEFDNARYNKIMRNLSDDKLESAVKLIHHRAKAIKRLIQEIEEKEI
jgi:hypothetical protein